MSNVINDLASAPQTFSSWDNCMAKAYCKYPAIVGIVVASLIALSIVWCIASCLCCGATLCGSCIKCLTCFGCCGLCETGSGGRKSRHKDEYNQMPPTPYNGYQPPPAQMAYNRTAPATQFAQFDVSKNNAHINEDSLPAMPTWANATSRRIEDNSEPPNRYAEDVEMGRMAPSPITTRGPYSQLPTNGPRSPLSPVPGQGQGYFPNQSHPYQSDLSAQRMSDHEHPHDNGLQSTPLSPAPTYTTYPHQPNQPHLAPGTAVTTDQFAVHAPTPQEYTRSQHHDYHYDEYTQQHHQQTHWMPPQQRGIVPVAMPTIPRAQSPPESTRYEVSHYEERPRSISPPQDMPQRFSYQPPTSQARPPSLLQVGRKPVVNSHREI